MVTNQTVRAETLESLVSHLPECDRGDTLVIALTAAEEIPDAMNRARLLAGLAVHVSESERATVLRKALRDLRSVGGVGATAAKLAEAPRIRSAAGWKP